jgi:dihydroxycyclohexadiene carboxylate dehydrogenase
VAVVTGAAQGILRGVALGIAAEGGRCCWWTVPTSSMKSPWKQLAGAAGFVADLETYDGAQAAMARAVNFGRIDILVNGVGGAIRMRPYAEFEAAQIDAEIRRSLMPTLYGCHAVLPHMLARGGAPSSTSPPTPRAASAGCRIRRPRAASMR